MAAAAEAAEGGRPLGALLGAIAQAAYHGQPLAEEPLRGQLYPEAAPEEFRALRAKMGGLLQVPEHVLFLDRIIQISRKSHEGGIKSIFLQTLTGDLNRSLVSMQSIASADMDLNQLEAFLTAQTKKQGGITSDQAAVIADFWKKHRAKIRESLINQSQWDNVLKNMNWRVDLKSQSRHIDQINTPVAIVEMELGKNGQESEFLCLEFDEAKVNQMLKKLSEIEASMSSLTQAS